MGKGFASCPIEHGPFGRSDPPKEGFGCLWVFCLMVLIGWYLDSDKPDKPVIEQNKPVIEQNDYNYEDTNIKISRKNGKVHSENDKPAIVSSDGIKIWYKNGLIHRDNNKPAIIYQSGMVEYWKNGVQYNPEFLKTTIKLKELNSEKFSHKMYLWGGCEKKSNWIEKGGLQTTPR